MGAGFQISGDPILKDDHDLVMQRLFPPETQCERSLRSRLGSVIVRMYHKGESLAVYNRSGQLPGHRLVHVREGPYLRELGQGWDHQPSALADLAKHRVGFRIAWYGQI
jgi:hypothetical protein